MYSFVKSRLHSTALALKSQDINTVVLSFTLFLFFLQCTIVREAHFIILFYFMAKGPLLVAYK